MDRSVPGVPSGGSSDVFSGVFTMALDVVPLLSFQAQSEVPLESGSSPISSKVGFLIVALFTFGAI